MVTTNGLVCPETKQALSEVPLEVAEGAIAHGPLRARAGGARRPIGPTPTVLVREDRACAYPVVDGIPILLAPEKLSADGAALAAGSDGRLFAEAYEEMEFYNAAADLETARAGDSNLDRILRAIQDLGPGRLLDFPDPHAVWLDAVYDSASQYEAYHHLAPLAGKRLLQLGGKASHAFKFLLAGASHVTAISPMLSEMIFSRETARRWDLESRLSCVVGVAEQLPFPADSFDGIFSGGCVHHMDTALAFRECARVLVPGGRFSATEPWRAPLYTIGTKLLGKREPEVHCRPLDATRLVAFPSAFDAAEVVHHGALTRYPLLALMKLGLPLGLETVWRIIRADDGLSSLVPGLRRNGSSIALLASRRA